MDPRIRELRELLSLHQERLQHQQSNLNELATDMLRNPLTSNLEVSGFDIKNARRIQTSNSLHVGTSVTVNKNILLGGSILDLEGVPINLGPGPLLENYEDSHIVKNGIGDITSQTTVADLKLNYSDITDIIAKMLRIEAPPILVPTISGASFTITTSNAHVKLNTVFPSSITLRFNRGFWSGAFESDGSTPVTTLPHNPGNLTILNYGFGFNGTNSNTNITTTSITNSGPPQVYYTENLPLAGNFNIWGDVTLTASMTTSNTSTGVVYNNYGNITTITPTNQTFNTTKIWSVYKPVFLDGTEVTISKTPGNGAGSNPNLPGTVKVFSDTTYIIYIDHKWGESMQIPFNPTNVQQYDASITNAWYDVQFVATPLSSDYVGYGQYYGIDLNIAERSIPIDVKIYI